MAAEPPKAAAAGRFKVQREECAVCKKAVYLTEKLAADGVVFHKNCFKCSQCAKTLSLGNYASLEGVYYCKPHFKQLFALKGNYSEGFGLQKPQEIWAAKQDPTEVLSASAPLSQPTHEPADAPIAVLPATDQPTTMTKAAEPAVSIKPPTQTEKPPIELSKPPAEPTKPPIEPTKPPIEPPIEPTKPPAAEPVKQGETTVRPPINIAEPTSAKQGVPSAQPAIEPINLPEKKPLPESSPTPAAGTPCCPKCSTPIVASTPVLAKFCRACGARLAGAVEGQQSPVGPSNPRQPIDPVVNRSPLPDTKKLDDLRPLRTAEVLDSSRAEILSSSPKPQSSKTVLVLFVVVVLIAIVWRMSSSASSESPSE